MNILGMGIDYTTGNLLCEAIDDQIAGRETVRALYRAHDRLLALTTVPRDVALLREKARRLPSPDYGDPRAAGWTYLLAADDPARAAITEIIQPLARHRGMPHPEAPLIYARGAEEDWWRWIEHNYVTRDLTRPPFYVLIIGDPDHVPFRFQALLQTIAATGRLHFDSPDDLQSYVTKVLRLENAPEPAVEREAIFFAPQLPPRGLDHDATYYSRRFLAEPIARLVGCEYGFVPHVLSGDRATKEALLATMRATRPALVFVASHGMVAPAEPPDVQRRVNGAICCQHNRDEPRERWLLSAADIARDQYILDGAILFQFTCFGYGTPARSEYAHWTPLLEELNTDTDFIAALPQRLLALPHGPVGFIGHVDAAWVCGFHDEGQASDNEHWEARVAPFAMTVRHLLHDLQPAGQAMAPIGQRYVALNSNLADDIDRLRRGDIYETPDFRAKQAQAYILRNDAQNYMVFGDPAVQLQVPATASG